MNEKKIVEVTKIDEFEIEGAFNDLRKFDYMFQKLLIRSDLDAKVDLDYTCIREDASIDFYCYYSITKHSQWTDSPSVTVEGVFPFHISWKHETIESGFVYGLKLEDPSSFTFKFISENSSKIVIFEGFLSDLAKEQLEALSKLILHFIYKEIVYDFRMSLISLNSK